MTHEELHARWSELVIDGIPTAEFWEMWEDEKDEMKAAGVLLGHFETDRKIYTVYWRPETTDDLNIWSADRSRWRHIVNVGDEARLSHGAKFNSIEELHNAWNLDGNPSTITLFHLSYSNRAGERLLNTYLSRERMEESLAIATKRLPTHNFAAEIATEEVDAFTTWLNDEKASNISVEPLKLWKATLSTPPKPKVAGAKLLTLSGIPTLGEFGAMNSEEKKAWFEANASSAKILGIKITAAGNLEMPGISALGLKKSNSLISNRQADHFEHALRYLHEFPLMVKGGGGWRDYQKIWAGWQALPLNELKFLLVNEARKALQKYFSPANRAERAARNDHNRMMAEDPSYAFYVIKSKARGEFDSLKSEGVPVSPREEEDFAAWEAKAEAQASRVQIV